MREKALEIIAESRDVAMSPAAIDEIILVVLVVENELIDRLSAVVKFIDEGMTQVIAIRAFGAGRHRYTDASPLLVILNVVGTKEKEILLAFLHDSRRPHGPLRPFDGSRINNVLVFGPVNQVI